MDIVLPAAYRVKNEENEKKKQYLDLTRELKNQWKLIVIPIVIGAIGTIPKDLVKGLEELEIGRRAETIQITALIRSARILGRFVENWRDLLSLKPQWKTSS